MHTIGFTHNQSADALVAKTPSLATAEFWQRNNHKQLVNRFAEACELGFRQERWSATVRILAHLGDNWPDEDLVKIVACKAMIELNEYERALELAKICVSNRPKCKSSLRLLAWAQLLNNNPESALKILCNTSLEPISVLNVGSDIEFDIKARALAKVLSGSSLSAEKEMNKLDDARPLLSARSLIEQDKCDEAVEIMLSQKFDYSRKPEFAYLLDLALKKADRHAEARRYLTINSKFNRHCIPHTYLRAINLFKTGAYVEALYELNSITDQRQTLIMTSVPDNRQLGIEVVHAGTIFTLKAKVLVCLRQLTEAKQTADSASIFFDSKELTDLKAWIAKAQQKLN